VFLFIVFALLLWRIQLTDMATDFDKLNKMPNIKPFVSMFNKSRLASVFRVTQSALVALAQIR
jgi:hypothetical protein